MEVVAKESLDPVAGHVAHEIFDVVEVVRVFLQAETSATVVAKHGHLTATADHPQMSVAFFARHARLRAARASELRRCVKHRVVIPQTLLSACIADGETE